MRNQQSAQPQPYFNALVLENLFERWVSESGGFKKQSIRHFFEWLNEKGEQPQPVSDAPLFSVEQMREAFEQEMDKEMQLMMDALEKDKYDKATMHEEHAAHIQHALNFMDTYLQSLTQNKEQ